MANLITVGRLVLLFLVIALVYFGDVTVITWCMVLIAIVFASDGLDGWIARRRGSASAFGAVFDIAGDRIVEIALWIVFADLNLIPIWVPLLVMTRAFIVDGLRSLSYAEGMTAFGERNMMRSPLTRWLTTGRFMRGLFGYAKAGGFVFLTGLAGHEHHNTDGTVLGDLYGIDPWRWFGWLMVGAAVALTVIRGLPVIFDAMAQYGAVPMKESGPPPPSTAASERAVERSTS
ncbi:MAG: CDP-alcohol phosphatidyltransferase family protein [Thermomicrobiales bacterium]